MLVLAGTLLGLLVAGAVVLLVLGLAALVKRRWKNGSLTLALGVASLPIVMLMLASMAYLLIPRDLWTNGVGPEEKARASAENISSLMNISVFGPPLGLTAGIALVWRRRGREGARACGPVPHLLLQPRAERAAPRSRRPR